MNELDALDDDELDALPYGVVRLDATGKVERFNLSAARGAGMQRWRVLGRNFYREIAGNDGRALATTVSSLAPGERARLRYRFRGYRRAAELSIEVDRTANGGAYLVIER